MMLISENDEELLSIWLTLWIVVEFVFAVDEGVVIEESADVDTTLLVVSEEFDCCEFDCCEFDSVSKAEVFPTLLLLTSDEKIELADVPKFADEVSVEFELVVEFEEVLKFELANEKVLINNIIIVNPNINNILIINFFLNIFPPM